MNDDTKIIAHERHHCPHCRNILILIEASELVNLDPEEEKVIKAMGAIIVKPGDTITCPHCKKTLTVSIHV